MTNYTVKATSVVELSLNRFFKRQYSSLFPAIGGYFTSRQNNKNKEEETVVNDDYRNCSIYAPPVNDQPSWLWIGEKISKAIYSFNSKDGWKFHLLGMAERPMMMKYEQGGPLHAGGKYDWHIDLGPGKVASSRKLGFSLFLNDDYEGGEIEFHFPKNILP